MRKQLSEKLKEAVASVIPVTLIVLLLQILTPMPTNMLIAFLIGAVMLVLGMGLFSLGADIAMMPMGERIGAHIIKSKHYLVLIPAVFMIGALITVAEPDLQVLADQFETLNRWAVILTVAAGVGFASARAVEHALAVLPQSLHFSGTPGIRRDEVVDVRTLRDLVKLRYRHVPARVDGILDPRRDVAGRSRVCRRRRKPQTKRCGQKNKRGLATHRLPP